MKSGLEYALSPSKRAFDLAFASGMLVPAKLAEAIAKATYARQAESPVYRQKRVGQFESPFVIQKLLTVNPVTCQPFNRLARLFRRYGVDEFANYANILDGTMSAVGRRPLIPVEFEEFMDHIPTTLQSKYSRLVVPTKPGVLSMFGIRSHKGFTEGVDDVFLIRAEMDIQDVVDGGLSHDLSVVGAFAASAIKDRLV